jgi:EAL domain-containing protein (putative c-di-GMP-specific phosphodiesterase class I)/GGDEF domain-containing protein
MTRWAARPTLQLTRIDVAPIITLENLPTASLIIDGLGRVVHFNERASTLLERPGSTLRGMRVVELLGRDLLETSIEASAITFPLTLTLPGGRRVGVIGSISALPDPSDGARLMVALTPSRIEGQPWIERVPRITPWADVAERVAAMDGEVLCIAIGIVGLRSVNDSFSRSAGDAVITEIVKRFVSVTPPGTIVERISGDRFIIACSISDDDARRVADIMGTLHAPIETRLGPAAVGCAVGVTAGPARPPLVLLDRADRNVSLALGRGAGTIEWSDSVPPQRAFVAGRLGAPLRVGVANRAISSHFQPVIELATGRVVEYEALARWQDERGDHHLAAHFIPVAEDTGVMREVGSQMLGSALQLFARMSGMLNRSQVPRVSVNVSASELADPAFADRVGARLIVASMPADMLQFELADSVGAEQAEYVRQNMRRLRSTGVRFALDGFGGVSANLVSLRDFDVDVVKLDRGLVNDALGDSRSLSLLQAIMTLASQIGLEVVAKGIETMEQHELLLDVGCRFGQGFLYSPPLPMALLDIGAQFNVGAALASL